MIQKLFGRKESIAVEPLLLIGSTRGRVVWVSTIADGANFSDGRKDEEVSGGNSHLASLVMFTTQAEIFARDLLAMNEGQPIKYISTLNLYGMFETDSEESKVLATHVIVVDFKGSVLMRGIAGSVENSPLEENYFYLPFESNDQIQKADASWSCGLWGGLLMYTYSGALTSVAITVDPKTSEVTLGPQRILSDRFSDTVKDIHVSRESICFLISSIYATDVIYIPAVSKLCCIEVTGVDEITDIFTSKLGSDMKVQGMNAGDEAHAVMNEMLRLSAEEVEILESIRSIDYDIYQLVTLLEILSTETLDGVRGKLTITASCTSHSEASIYIICSDVKLCRALQGIKLVVSLSKQGGASSMNHTPLTLSHSALMTFLRSENEDVYHCELKFPLTISILGSYRLDLYAILPTYDSTASSGEEFVTPQLYLGYAELGVEVVLPVYARAQSHPLSREYGDTMSDNGTSRCSLTTHIPQQIGIEPVPLDSLIIVETHLRGNKGSSNTEFLSDHSVASKDCSILLPTFMEAPPGTRNASPTSMTAHTNLDVRSSISSSKVAETMNGILYRLPHNTSSSLSSSDSSAAEKLAVRTLTLRSSRPQILAATHAICTRMIRSHFSSTEPSNASTAVGSVGVSERPEDTFRDRDIHSMPPDLQQLYSECSQYLHTFSCLADDYYEGTEQMPNPQEVLRKIWNIYSRLRELGC